MRVGAWTGGGVQYVTQGNTNHNQHPGDLNCSVTASGENNFHARMHVYLASLVRTLSGAMQGRGGGEGDGGPGTKIF